MVELTDTPDLGRVPTLEIPCVYAKPHICPTEIK